jgi:RNA polymerase primary sigma factor
LETKTMAGYFLDEEEKELVDDFFENEKIAEDRDSEKEIFYEPGDPENNIQRYFLEISKYPLLGRKEQKELFVEIEKEKVGIKRIAHTMRYCKYMRKIARVGARDVLDIEIAELKNLIFKKKARIKELKNQAVETSLRFVVNFVKRYAGYGLPFLDLIQEGNRGLIRTVDKFQYRKGWRLTTSATWAIRSSITKAFCDQARTIRIPVKEKALFNRIAKVSKELTVEYGREPYTDEIVERLQIAIEKIEEKWRAEKELISIHEPIATGNNLTLEDSIVNEDGLSLCVHAEKNQESKEILKILKTLTPQQEYVIRLRFGIGCNCGEHTLEEIGNRFSTTRERVRQIEEMVLKKLKHPSRSAKFIAGRENNDKKLPKKSVNRKEINVAACHSPETLKSFSNQALLDLLGASVGSEVVVV